MASRNPKANADLSASSSLTTVAATAADGANLDTEGVSQAGSADTAQGDGVTAATLALSGTDAVAQHSAAVGPVSETNIFEGDAAFPIGANIFLSGVVTIYINDLRLKDDELRTAVRADLIEALRNINEYYFTKHPADGVDYAAAFEPASDTDTSQGDTATAEAGNLASLGDPVIFGGNVSDAATWMGIDLVNELGEFKPAEAVIERVNEFRSKFPKLSALAQAAHEAGLALTRFRVTSSVDGLRRGGIRHPKGTTEFTSEMVADIQPAQVEAMLNEPALTVELI